MLYEKNGELWSDASHHPLNSVRCEVMDVNGAKVVYHTGLRVVGNEILYTDYRCILGTDTSRYYSQARLYFWERCLFCNLTFAQLEAEYRSRFGPIHRRCVSHYVNLIHNLTYEKASCFAEILKCKPEELMEIFTPPKTRGIGDWWEGERGTLIQDYGTPPDPEEFFSKFTCN